MYVEPFCGSAAVLLSRPHKGAHEVLNDVDCLVVNFWRAVRAAPDEVARWADFPINETEVNARHRWLLRHDLRAFTERLDADPDYYDARVAGYWVYGQSVWIGHGWCRPREQSGEVRTGNKPRLCGPAGIHRQLPEIRHGQGIFAQGMRRQRPMRSPRPGRVVAPGGHEPIYAWLEALAERLKDVRVCCGDWRRVCTDCVTERDGGVAVFLDPPYCGSRKDKIYTRDSKTVARDAWAWALAKGQSPGFRIALCGLEGDYQMPPDWRVFTWKSHGHNTKRGHLERIYFSPHCL
jgi:hypothetical protein